MLDRFLYSNAVYIINFDDGILYADNFILEDTYEIINKYNLDSVLFSYRETFAKNPFAKNDLIYNYSPQDRKIIYGIRYCMFG